ncbi:sugar ABC transporter substrate-binding protein [Aeromicrobium sp. Leaf350]|uniref:sugar ABC transporter substrate-binding protein n=1 Tax=Aeromicrobium sp. Leaf350 TaxID=2876565 RepID=UPI001E376111|nr:sugar ABC transporter substrate-binding protein [Aeromicrobium sp. Leaf350]
MKINLTARVLACMALAGGSLAACGTDSGEGGGSSEDSYTIGFVNSDTLDFHTCLEEGLTKAADGASVEVISANSARDPGKEQSNIEDMIVRQVDAIILQTVNIDSLTGAVAQANAAGIPIFLTSVSGPDKTKILGAELSDVFHNGELAAQWLEEDAAGDDVDAAIIAGAPGAASDLFVKGFREALPDSVDVVFEQPGMFQRAKAQEVAENLLQSNPDVSYVFVPNEEMAFGAATAFANAGRDDIKIIANGGTPEGLEAVESGQFAMLVASSPADLGKKALETTVDQLEADAPEPAIGEIPLTVVTKDNVADAPSYCG